MKTAQVITKILENHGVTHAYGLPGEENIHLLDALRESTIEPVITHHENSAGFMANIASRHTENISVLFTTLGPGATNAVTAVSQAFLAGNPMLIITADKSITHEYPTNFQRLDLVNLFKPITKASVTVNLAEEIPEKLQELIDIAEADKRGPVHIQISEDILSSEMKEMPHYEISTGVSNLFSDATIQNFIKEFKVTKSPVLLIGDQLTTQDRSFLRKIIEQLQLPFMTTISGKGSYDENSNLYLGTPVLSDNDPLNILIEQYIDTIITIGLNDAEKLPINLEASHTKILNIANYNFHTEGLKFDHSLIGNVGAALKGILENFNKPSMYWDYENLMKVSNQLNKDLTTSFNSNAGNLNRLISILNEHLTIEDKLFLDNGLYKLFFARYFKAQVFSQMNLDNSLATMGAGLPMAIGYSKLKPQDRSIAVVGDGGLLMSLGELATAVRLNANLLIILLRDNSFGMIKWKQHKEQMIKFGLDIQNPDFVKLAESFGASGHRLSNLTTDLSPFLQTIRNQKGVHLLDLEITYPELQTLSDL